MQSTPLSTNSGPGKSFLVVGVVVAAGLGGFYASMLNRKHKQQAEGSNPHHEQLLANYGRKPAPEEPLSTVLSARYSDNPPAFPIRAEFQNNGHTTRDNYKDSPQYLKHGEAILYMVPPPQKARTDGSGKAYTKSADYVDSYDKVKKIRKETPEA